MFREGVLGYGGFFFVFFLPCNTFLGEVPQGRESLKKWEGWGPKKEKVKVQNRESIGIPERKRERWGGQKGKG